MSQALLGTRFDIHGGGLDLKFPHHENEIAQSCAASGDEFARVWMHNGFLTLDEEKMSKSLGNVFTIREVLKRVRDPEVIRYFVLASHYRGPVNYSVDQLDQAGAALGRLYTALRDLPAAAGPAGAAGAAGAAVAAEPAVGGTAVAGATEHTERFDVAMEDDFNTPEALAALQTLARELNSARATGQQARAAALGAELRALAGVLGILALPAERWFKSGGAEGPGAAGAALSDGEIDRLIAARTEARAAKNWAESDRIRAALAGAGVILEDSPGGRTTWRRT